MKKVIISVLGRDRPGIIAAVTGILFDLNCNIENVSQTILQSEFSGIFIISVPPQLSEEEMQSKLNEGLGPMDLHVTIKHLDPARETSAVESEPFVITTRGPDRKGLVAAVTSIFANYGVNVTNLQAVFKGGSRPDDNIMIYQVDVPRDADQQSLRRELCEKARELNLEISIQHQNIFEAINRI